MNAAGTRARDRAHGLDGPRGPGVAFQANDNPNEEGLMRILKGVVPILAAGLLLAGCKKEQAPKQPLGGAQAMTPAPKLEPKAQVQLDSGNTAYRAKDYQTALTHYQAAVEAAPHAPATWFGVYMAQSALGNKPAADSAMRKARALAPGATLMHPGTADSTKTP